MFDGERLAELRKDRGLRQKELGDVLGIGHQMVSYYENGRSIPPDDVKEMIAKYFNVSLDYLCGLIDEEVPYERQWYIALPTDSPTELKKEMLNHLDLLKIKYGIDQKSKK